MLTQTPEAWPIRTAEPTFILWCLPLEAELDHQGDKESHSHLEQ